MTEVVGVAAVLSDESAPPHLVEALDEGHLVDVVGLGDETGGERPPDRRRDAEHGRAGAESWRIRASITACSFGLIASPPARGAGPHGLDDEERVALRLGIQPVGGGLVEVVVRQAAGPTRPCRRA